MSWFRRPRAVPVEGYIMPDGFDVVGALAFTREHAPAAWQAVMLELQDRIADAMDLASAMATAKEQGYAAHAAGQLSALLEVYSSLEARRQAALAERI